jgi:hypothetical protein
MVTEVIESKVAAVGIGAYAATLAVGLLNRYTSYHPTPEEVGAIVGLFGVACGYLVPSRLRTNPEV